MKKAAGFDRSGRKHEIISAARKIISSKGFANLTVRQIARDLNLTDGALYRHFKSKKEIVSLLIDNIEDTLLSAIEEAARARRDPLDKLFDIFLSHLSYAEQRKGITFIIMNETLSLKDKGLQDKMFGVIDRYLKTIKLILKEGIASGRFRGGLDLVSASLAFFGTVQSTVTIWALGGFKYSLRKDHLKEIFSIYKRGILR